VKLARSLRLLGNTAQACRTLSLMSSNFPKAPALAKQLADQERQQAKCA
jgi:TolA-binding protein